MRFSMLTVVVFVAHTSTLAIAAPLPVPGDVQDLVARADDDPPAPSSGSSGASANWKTVLSMATKVPIPNSKISALQKLVGAALSRAASTPSRRPYLLAERPKQGGASGPKSSVLHEAMAAWKKNEAQEQSHRGQQSHPSGSSPTRKTSPESKAAHKKGKASQPRKGRRVYKVGTSHKVFKGPMRKSSVSLKKASASTKKGKAPTLRKRDLEIDELD